MHDAIEIALRVAAAIEAVGGEYFIGGSLASSFQGEPRSTNDIDIVVSLAMSQLERFKLALGNDFEADLESLRDAFLRKGCANIFFLPSVMKIDIFAVGSSEFDAEEFRRRQSVRVRSSGETLFLKTAEDSILRKLLWFREGGEVSERQWRDVVALLRINSRSLDFSYIERWSRALRLDSLLRRAREASS